MVGFERVEDRVFRLPISIEGNGTVSVYLIHGARTALVDTGVVNSPTLHLAPALSAIGLTLSDVDLVFNSHGHWDHVGGNAELADAGAQLAIHSADQARASSRAEQLRLSVEGMRQFELSNLAEAYGAFVLRQVGRDVGIERLLKDGDVIGLGASLRLRVLHTPGHTPGSVCLLLEPGGLLFTGDAVQRRGSRAGALPVIEHADSYAESLRRIESTAPRALLMAHSFVPFTGRPLPVVTGAAVESALADSLRVHNELTLAAGHARLSPTTPRTDAEAIVARLREPLGLTDTSAEGLPRNSGLTLPAYLAAALERRNDAGQYVVTDPDPNRSRIHQGGRS